MSKRSTALLCATVSAACLAVSNGHAQQASGGLEEVVVTARRIEERLQSIPLAVTAFDQSSIEKKNITQLTDMTRSVPSLSTTASMSDANAYYSGQVRLRGLPGTVIYFADVPLGNTDYNPVTGITHGTSTGQMYDLQNVQIVKGPQGTLFGKNSVGGLISIQPQKPTNNYEGYLQGKFGNYKNREFEGAVNVPVVEDKLMLRAATQMQTRNGYTKDISNGRDYDDRNFKAWRLGMTFRPTDNLDIYTVYDGYYQNSHGGATIPSFVNPNFAFAQIPLGPGFSLPLTLGNGPSIAGLSSTDPAVVGATFQQALAAGGFSFFPNIMQVLAQQQALGVRKVTGRSIAGIGKNKFHGVTNTITWDINDDLTLKNVFGARFYKQLSTVDDFGSLLPVLNIGHPAGNFGWNEDSAHYTNEIQLQGSSFDNKLNWVLGGFLEFYEPIGPTYSASAAVGNVSYYHFEQSARSKALFAHAIYDMGDFVEGLRLTGGFRYTWDFVSTQEVGYNGVDGVVRDAAGNATNCAPIIYDNNCHVGATAKFKASGWNLAVDQQVTPDTLVYVRSGKAYRPGDTNPQVPVQYQKIQPEHVTDLEIGIKSDWTLGPIRGRTNFDVFQSWYKDVQVSQLAQVIDSQGQPHAATLRTNAASAKLRGMELEGTIIPIEGLEISPMVSWLYSKYSKYPVELSGGEAPPFLYMPRWKYGVSGTYHLPLDTATWGDISFTASWYRNGRMYNSPPTSGEIFPIIPAYDNLDVRVDWVNVMGKSIDAAFYMTNARNQTYVAGAFPIYNQLGFTSLTYNEPRMYGVSIKVRFGPGTDFLN